MILIKLILIYFIIINFFFFNKKKKEFLGFDHWGHFLRSLAIVLGFMVFFIFFLRVLGLFREHKTLDLGYYLEFYDLHFIFLFLVVVFLLRRNIFFLVKLNFLKLHYFGSISYLPMNPYSEVYRNFYSKFVVEFSKFFYQKTFWLNKILTVVMLVLILKDLVLNNMILDGCLGFAPWYSVYKFLFICARFVAIKQNPMLDYYSYCICYVHTGFIPDNAAFYIISNESWKELCISLEKYEREVVRI